MVLITFIEVFILGKRYIAVSLAFVVLVGGISLAGLLAKDRSFSANENRYLAKAPEFTIKQVFSGDFQDGLETYLNDQIWMRDGWITVKTAVQKACGDTDIGGAYVGSDGYDFEKILPQDVDDALVQRNIQSVSDYFAYCRDEAGLDSERLTFLLVPTSGLVMEEKLPENAILFDQQAYIDQVKEAMEAYNFIDVRGILAEHKDEEIYYRTDHHWTSTGAFYAYEAWCHATGHTFPGSDAFEKVTVSTNFRGSLYSKILDRDSAYDSIQRIYPSDGGAEFAVTADGVQLDGFYIEEKLQEKDQYAYFFGGNYGEVIIERLQSGKTDASEDHPPEKKGAGRNLLVVKDSFANSFVPLLSENYDSVYMIDLRYYNGNLSGYLTEHDITEVLVLYNISNFISDKNIYKLGYKL